MGYYMRYLFEGEPEIRLESIESALKAVDEGYAFAEWENDKQSAEIRYGGDVYGAIDLEHIDEDDGEIQEMLEGVSALKGWLAEKKKKRVTDFLKQVRVRIVVRVLWGGRDGEATLAKLDPLWDWLISNYKGLLHADGEGFYEGKKLILKMG